MFKMVLFFLIQNVCFKWKQSAVADFTSVQTFTTNLTLSQPFTNQIVFGFHFTRYYVILDNLSIPITMHIRCTIFYVNM